jgi:tellurite resistance protein TehA-like permease
VHLFSILSGARSYSGAAQGNHESALIKERLMPMLVNKLENLNPAYFALVMSTGIISIAAHYQGLDLIATILFRFNMAAYVILWIMYIARIIFFTRRFRDDFRNHTVGMGFFTSVAASGVLGSQTLLLTGCLTFATVLWCITIALWIGLIYGLFTGLITKEAKPTIAEGINGGWLLAIVATQAVTVLSTAIAPFLQSYREPLLFLAFITWLFGGMLYIWIISLIFYRYLFFHFSPQDLTPPYWINMGAVAITTLGGTGLISNAASSPFMIELTPFLKGFTFFFWATATWWIPMLVILGVWRHGYRRFPLRYSPLFWGAVFPLGMYTACTHRLAEVTAAPLIAAIPKVFIYVAMAAWALTFAGMVHSIVADWRKSKVPA